VTIELIDQLAIQYHGYETEYYGISFVFFRYAMLIERKKNDFISFEEYAKRSGQKSLTNMPYLHF